MNANKNTDEQNAQAQHDNDEARRLEKIKATRFLNDRLRTTLDTKYGRIVVTPGVADLPNEERIRVVELVRTFPEDKFTEANDPHGEHDFGTVLRREQSDPATDHFYQYHWKIDYYDRDSDFSRGSEDPSEPLQTIRVLTIMHASEY